MTDLSTVSDELLEAIRELDPEFPLCTADCMTWKLEHRDCKGCKYFLRCRDLILGMEVGTALLIKKMFNP